MFGGSSDPCGNAYFMCIGKESWNKALRILS